MLLTAAEEAGAAVRRVDDAALGALALSACDDRPSRSAAPLTAEPIGTRLIDSTPAAMARS